MPGVCRRNLWRRLWWERLARSLFNCVVSSHRSSSAGPNRSLGSISRTTRYTWGRVIRGIFSPPILLQAQQEGSRQQAQRDVMMPARPGAGFVLVQPHVALISLEFCLNVPAGVSMAAAKWATGATEWWTTGVVAVGYT